jgi:hypothetical protein
VGYGSDKIKIFSIIFTHSPTLAHTLLFHHSNNPVFQVQITEKILIFFYN